MLSNYSGMIFKNINFTHKYLIWKIIKNPKNKSMMYSSYNHVLGLLLLLLLLSRFSRVRLCATP